MAVTPATTKVETLMIPVFWMEFHIKKANIMKSHKVPSISRNLTISLVVAIFALFITFLSFYYYQLLQREQLTLENTANNYIQSMISTLEIPLWDIDRENIKRVCSFYFENEWVDRVTLIGVSGEIMYDETMAAQGKDSIQRSGNIFNNRELIGEVTMAFSPLPSRQDRRVLLKTAIITLLIAIAGVIAFTGFFLKKFLQRPMTNISHMARAYAEGDYHPRVEGTTYKEFVHLVSALEEMGDRIETQVKTLQRTDQLLTRHKNHLEEMVEMRTQELEASNKKLQQAEKMEAIGTLAGGVAHDLNNILSGLVSYPELILMDISQDNPLRQPLLTIQKSGERAAQVVQDLLTMARRGVSVTAVLNLNQIIHDQLKTPEMDSLKSFHSGMIIETMLEPELLNVVGSTTHLAKSIMNLISNAAEAMSHGGVITISTKNVYLDMPIKGYEEVKEGDYVIVSVSDTGTGLAEADMVKIFEPFYTKKEMGRSGSGLGMAVVWGTVKDHDGYIDIRSSENVGTTFTLYLPVTREKISDVQPEPPVEAFRGSGQSILVVDDVEEQRKIATIILKKLGYHVVTAPSGEAACQYLKNTSVDLIVLDMIMDPGMDGLQTYKQILTIHPGQKAIIASGFSLTERVKAIQRLGAGQYVKKPYTLAQLGAAVKAALEN